MAAHQAPPSLGFSRQEHWSGLPFPSPMHESEKWEWSRSVMSDSSWPHGLQPTRLLSPWDFPGKNTGRPQFLNTPAKSVFCALIIYKETQSKKLSDLHNFLELFIFALFSYKNLRYHCIFSQQYFHKHFQLFCLLLLYFQFYSLNWVYWSF